MMTPERFAYLADAYGADLRRWPAAERQPAQALLDSGDARARASLAQAQGLDSLLDSHRLPAPHPALGARIAASANLPVRRPLFSGHHTLWSRLGLLGVGVAGIAAGMLAVSLSLATGNGTEALPSIFDQNDAEIVYTISTEDSEQ